MTQAVIEDATGRAGAVWFGRQGVGSALSVGGRAFFYGAVTEKNGRFVLQNPEFALADSVQAGDRFAGFGCIVPVYPLTEGLKERWLRNFMAGFVVEYAPQAGETVPAELIQKYGYMSSGDALLEMHRPTSRESWLAARERLVYEEFFALHAEQLQKRAATRNAAGAPPLGDPAGLAEKFAASLPFEMTGSQKEAVAAIAADLAGPRAMNRLLQGDVGSGKTVVALAAIARAAGSSSQAALLAPTAILARQLHRECEKYLAPLGIACALLIGSTGAREKREIKVALASGEIAAVVGTHALLEDDVAFANLGLVIVDEQHRFGAEQRRRLARKALAPHVLTMSATPIPRTLCLAVYGDTDVSRLAEKPPRRVPVETRVLSMRDEPRLMKFLRSEIVGGNVGFWVCPMIGDGDEAERNSVVARAETLRGELPGAVVEILHGRQSPDERAEIFSRFAGGEVSLLVATTIVEVGVDVPGANLMVVESAQRFGLSQLHQLRGRIGRGSQRGYCFLIDDADEPSERLAVMQRTDDGFAIAEEDLRRRGPGEFLNAAGRRQHGAVDLKIADIVRDEKIMLAARGDAEKYFSE